MDSYWMRKEVEIKITTITFRETAKRETIENLREK